MCWRLPRHVSFLKLALLLLAPSSKTYTPPPSLSSSVAAASTPIMPALDHKPQRHKWNIATNVDSSISQTVSLEDA
ncbi:hypothetical protein GALMADRAFT_230948 [Galerina marginata CBS 339.88]|uniref:Secreted protein n=1 Tax=Galerina marginata (strain CBS 339.88) TaxID=685588 RepID=A0A067SME1_GALM3|nr:hypothetical protein GALMADRAFT_230948 [Galerina marginata CBS 339.88]